MSVVLLPSSRQRLIVPNTFLATSRCISASSGRKLLLQPQRLSPNRHALRQDRYQLCRHDPSRWHRLGSTLNVNRPYDITQENATPENERMLERPPWRTFRVSAIFVNPTKYHRHNLR